MRQVFPTFDNDFHVYWCYVDIHRQVFSGVRVVRSLVFCVIFCIIIVFFSWPLYCLSYDFRLLIIPLVSSNFSPLAYYCIKHLGLFFLINYEEWMKDILVNNTTFLFMCQSAHFIFTRIRLRKNVSCLQTDTLLCLFVRNNNQEELASACKKNVIFN